MQELIAIRHCLKETGKTRIFEDVEYSRIAVPGKNQLERQGCDFEFGKFCSMTITSIGVVSNAGVRNQIIKRSTAKQFISARSVIGEKGSSGLDGQCKMKESLTLILQSSDLPHKLTGFICSDAGRNHSSSDPCSSP